MKRLASLRHLLAGPDPIIAPGVYDGLTARLVESAGFNAIYLDFQELHALGYKIVIAATTLVFTVMRTARETLEEMRALGRLEAGLAKMEGRNQYQRIIGWEAWRGLEETYLPPGPASSP